MAERKETKKQWRRQLAYCSACKEHFMTYSLAQPNCPRCGRPAATVGRRRLLHMAAVAALTALVAAAILGYLFMR